MLEINNIYNMDCIEGMKSIKDCSIDLIVTDPPYLINYKTNYRKDKTHEFCKAIENDSNPQLIIDYIEQCYRVLKENTSMYMFCSPDTVEFFKKEIQKVFHIKNMIIWVKNNWTAGDLEAQYGKQYEVLFYVNKGRCKINGKRITDVWHFDRVAGNEQKHQNQKPIDILSRCINNSSKPNDLVLDGFAGSGSTAVTCIKTKRNFITFEIDNQEYLKAKTWIDEMDNQISFF